MTRDQAKLVYVVWDVKDARGGDGLFRLEQDIEGHSRRIRIGRIQAAPIVDQVKPRSIGPLGHTAGLAEDAEPNVI